jgi:hypothetical protein
MVFIMPTSELGESGDLTEAGSLWEYLLTFLCGSWPISLLQTLEA